MSLNHIINNSDSAADINPLNLLCKSLQIKDNSIYNNSLSSILYTQFLTVSVKNASNDEIVAYTNLYLYRINNLCTAIFTPFGTNNLSISGQLKIDVILPDGFKTLNNNEYHFLIPNSKNSDMPVFNDKCMVKLDNDNFIYLVNDGNGGNFPNGDNVVVLGFSFSYVGI